VSKIEDALEIIRQHQNGKTVQMKNKNGEWVDVQDFLFWTVKSVLNTDKQLRIKPEPREFWMFEYNDGGTSFACWDTKTDCLATIFSSGLVSQGKPIKVRVVEE